LYKFKKGDLFYVYWNQVPLVFEVEAREIFSPDEKNIYDVFPVEDDEKVVILQTC
jgi:sortase (surface protein transpeptidase)